MFIDTNILVHATAAGSVENKRAIAALGTIAFEQPAAISRQVLREYLSVMTRPQAWGVQIGLAEALGAGAAFQRVFRILEDGPIVWAALERLASTVEFGGKQVHDANLVATMLAHGETRLLTYNARHFRRFAGLIEIIEP